MCRCQRKERTRRQGEDAAPRFDKRLRICHDGGMPDLRWLRDKYSVLRPFLNERQRRLWAAAEARALGYGGIRWVAEATGLDYRTVARGMRELVTITRDGSSADEPSPSEAAHAESPPAVLLPDHLRHPGGGRKRLAELDPTLLADLEALVEPATRGDPMSPLQWTCKSMTNLADELHARGHPISPRTVAGLLHAMHYSLQADRKTLEGGTHPDRNAQFARINADVEAFQARGAPVISVDAKKKELVGPYKNGGREWQPKGMPEETNVYDFPNKELGKVTPYGVYDLTANAGWVSVGTDHDTAQFAVQTIETWWEQMGRTQYAATELLIVADGGGSNGSHNKLWKIELQRLANTTGLSLVVRHFPPGCSKWNKIEHRLFSQITQNWRGRPLVSHEVIVELIGHTTTRTGLQVQAALDPAAYPTGREVTDAEMARIHIEKDSFHGEWNYTIRPSSN